MSSPDYFAEATGIVRAHEANRLHDEATERMLASFKRTAKQRRAERPDDFLDTQTQAEVDAEALALFNAAEAQGINEVMRGRT